MIRTIKRGERETHVTPAEQKRNAKEFVKRWKAAEGNEEREARSFWIELVQECLGIPQATRVLDFERKVRGRRVDVFYEDMGILIENKSRGCSLDETYIRSKKAGEETPYQQGKWYADNMPNSVRPRWILVCNFDEIRIHDLEREDPETDFVSISLEELPDHLYLLRFFTDKGGSRIERERDLSVQAGELVGRLYSQLYGQYKHIDTDEREQRSLNILIVRLVFLLYAEDSGLLHKKDALLEYLRPFAASQMRQAVIDLFKVLDTPEDARDEYVSEELNAFPYVNGGLFAQEDIIIPQFTEQIRLDLLLEASQSFDWSGISPVIFGAAFESTLNPETRRSGGMHYTSVENIHKVIDPLFLDDLKAELAQIEGEKVEKNRKIRLKAFQRKLSSIKIFDPACGSGNFLTESYLSLRRLENRVLEDLQGDQVGIAFDEASSPICVGIDQFFGIEINDFAVSVAKTALWIAEEQMMEATQEILLQPFDFLPLKSNDNIHEGNALRMDWNGVLPAEECAYIVGNPPFLGYTYQSEGQKEDVANIWVDGCGKAVRGSGKLDYVSCWYRKAATYMRGTGIHAALVSTNSICQGEQVPIIWGNLLNEGGLSIDFAWPSFVWSSEANDMAHVHVVIVGFSCCGASEKKRIYSDNSVLECDNINPYLVDAPTSFVNKSKKPICDAPLMSTGNRPADGGHLIIEADDYEGFVHDELAAKVWIRPLLGSREFINGKERWCLWLKGASDEVIDSMPKVRQRVEACRLDRASAPDAGRRKLAATPHLFREQKDTDHAYLVVPKVSSERREYVPIGYVFAETICTDLLFVILDGGLYHFGILTSQFHNAWMRTVAGRLESRYRYSQDLVYNTFPWPTVSEEQRSGIERCAQAVLDARDAHPGKSLADLYDPDKMPSDLLAAHKALDAAVEAAYGVDFGGDEEKIVAHLFKLYAQMTQG